MSTGRALADPEEAWSVSFGGSDDDAAYAVAQAADGGYVLAGETRSAGAGGRDVWLVKTDAEGNQVWTTTLGGTNDDVAYDIQATRDGGFVIAGKTHSFRTDGEDTAVFSDFWLIKTDSEGNELWSQAYGNQILPMADGGLPTSDVAYSVQETADGGFIMAGQTFLKQDDEPFPSNHFWLVKTGPDGTEQWRKVFGGTWNDEARAVRQTADGGYILAGSTMSASNGETTDAWLVKTGADGNLVWSQAYGGSGIDMARDVIQAPDGGYVFTGLTNSSGEGFSDFWMVKTDGDGNQEWATTFGGLTRETAHSISQTCDGGYVMAGWTESFPPGDNFLLVKADADGNLVWDQLLGDSAGAYDIEETADGGYIIAGWTGSLFGLRDFLLIKTQPDCNVPAASRAVAVLENTGPSSITAALVGFDPAPDGSPYEFLYGGAFVSADNPLPPGQLACTVAIEGLASGSRLVLDQIGSFDSPLIDAVTGEFGAPELEIDVTTLAFDLAYPSATEGRIAGVYSFVLESPCAAATPAPALPPQPAPTALAELKVMDFFGVVISVSGDILVVSIDGEPAQVAVNSDTKIRLPRIPQAGLADLSPGDVVAVSLKEVDGQLVADKIHLIPGKTQFRHIPGSVIFSSATEITIQPPGKGKGPLTFTITPSTRIKLRGNASEIAVGSFVVVGAARDPATGGLATNALEINVTGRKIRQPAAVALPADPIQTPSTAEIQGVFGGVNPDGSWDIGGNAVFLDESTLIDDGLVAGQVLEVEAVIQEDGTLLALSIESEDQSLEIANTTKLEGVFQGIDESTGNWIISGTAVTVDASTDTDGLPEEGQRVEVTAVLQDDGSLLAREIENAGPGLQADAEENLQFKIEGIFQGIDPAGRWLVNGAAIAVDPLTRLEGTLAVGSRVEVKAIVQSDGTPLATKIEGEEKDIRKPKNRAKIRGIIQSISDDGTLQINGISVALSVLTESAVEPKVGDLVAVDALIQTDGTLVAREVETAEAGELAEPSKVNIEGIVDAVNPDGSIVVNGITVAISVLSDIQIDLAPGQSIKLKGLIRGDGSITAREIKGKGRKTGGKFSGAKVEGRVERVNRDESGRVISLVVDGLTVAVEALTETEIALEPGAQVEIDAIVIDGKFAAKKIERAGRGASRSSNARNRGVKLEGAIEALQTDNRGRVISVMVNGIHVAVAALDRSRGSLQVGQTVELETNNTGGVLRASQVKTKKPEKEKQRFDEFDVSGIVEAVDRDDTGILLAIVVNGQKFAVEALTKVEGDLGVGASVKLEGIVVDGVLLASEIEGPKAKGRPDNPGSQGQGASNGRGRPDNPGSQGRGAGNSRGKAQTKTEIEDGAGLGTSDTNKDSSGSGSTSSTDEKDSSGSGSGSSSDDEKDSSGSGSGSGSSADDDAEEAAKQAEDDAKDAEKQAEKDAKEAAESAIGVFYQA
ncbi:MAG: hypothetical protein IIC99_05550 [Chloroflexi bacterium]|nr:hypothetical protein [Chloroflexota bacterium]